MALTNKITRKTNAAWQGLLPALYKLINIPAYNHERIIRVCVLSILQYGLFLLLNATTKELKALKVLYNTLIRWHIGARNTTPLELVYFLADACRIEDIIKISGAKYWIHLLSLPQHHALYPIIERKWFHIWKRYIEHGIEPVDTNDRCNPIWQCFLAAIDLQLLDLVPLQHIQQYGDIPKAPGYHRTLPRIPYNLEFIEAEYEGREFTKENVLWIFVDGSVKYGLGGLGVNICGLQFGIDYGLCIGKAYDINLVECLAAINGLKYHIQNSESESESESGETSNCFALPYAYAYAHTTASTHTPEIMRQ
eukprot:874432_1